MQAVHDCIGKYVVISLFPASYLAIGIFQIWFGGVLYGDYSEMDPGITLHIGVPVHPVWLVEMLSAVIYLAICRYRNRSGVSGIRHEKRSCK